jgi:hypothetical protein
MRTSVSRQQKLFDILSLTPNVDVPIYEIYGYVFDCEDLAKDMADARGGIRAMQQRIAPIAKRFNEKFGPDTRIVVGYLKQTYRLSVRA